MNLLAHAYLSFNHPEILVGNLISDYVKGRKKFDYPEGIQLGIELHRAIDAFTDEHPVTKQAAVYFKADYRLYASAFIDIVYDHFLANDTSIFPDDAALMGFSKNVYQQIAPYAPLFPAPFSGMYPYMKSQDWLYNYKFASGINKSFNGLVHRAAYINDAAPAFHTFNLHYQELQQLYAAFFPDLQSFTIHQFKIITKKD